METPYQVGITGGIGSGKSLVCKIFQSLGVPIYDADSHAKALMTTDGILIANIQKEFGHLSFNSDGSVNRSYLSETVFNNPEKLKKLNELVHPRVKDDYTRWVQNHRNYQYVLKEAALLFETGSYKDLNKIIVVHAPEPLRIERVMRRDVHRTKEQVREIISNQMNEEEKMRQADFILYNDENQLLIPQVIELHKKLVASEA
ncbi:MAG TPA: dephospho-CoA kinase [Chryseolinea sp.]|nr:dephospho-CoA kinase [Chryseolinea sp.]HPM28888.1 dephospho-CoA kinase [Chryseolinea sp.]